MEKYRTLDPEDHSVAGHANHPLTYYFGSTGGGVWKTIDGGNEWFPISDIFKSSAVGAITVAPSDANVVYVGMGEAICDPISLW
jgi:hypothetical protein